MEDKTNEGEGGEKTLTLLCPNCEKETRVLIPVKAEIAEGTTMDSFWCMSCINNEDEEV